MSGEGERAIGWLDGHEWHTAANSLRRFSRSRRLSLPEGRGAGEEAAVVPEDSGDDRCGENGAAMESHWDNGAAFGMSSV